MKNATPPSPGERLIKRYGNRKLYEPAARRYVTVEDLGRSVAAGQDVRVVDSTTGEDLTSVVLAQVILDRVKEHTGWIPQPVLVRLIRLAAAPAGHGAGSPAPHDAAQRARAEAERIVTGLLGRGRLSLDEALALRQEIAGSVQRIVGGALAGLRERLAPFEAVLEPRAARPGTARRRTAPAARSRGARTKVKRRR